MQRPHSDEAVSAVMGAILMVAITVIIASVVFIIVHDRGYLEDDSPEVGFRHVDDECTLTVIKAPTGGETLDWSSLDVAVTGGTVSGNTGLVEAGDRITLSEPCVGVTARISHLDTNTLLYTANFA